MNTLHRPSRAAGGIVAGLARIAAAVGAAAAVVAAVAGCAQDAPQTPERPASGVAARPRALPPGYYPPSHTPGQEPIHLPPAAARGGR